MGIGGAIAFASAGDQQSKAMGILRFAPDTSGQPGAVLRESVIAVVGGKDLFCGQTNCQPS
jgi:hypothetical protein